MPGATTRSLTSRNRQGAVFPPHPAYPLLMASKKIKPPKGTRDLYPEDVLRQRYITNAWRDASIRCGFDEIAGPTFESTDLYAVKSGDGILGELFQAFSGKGGTETLNKLVEKGKADFALRPEFTPTLARMYAAKSKELPKPCKWFTAGPYFRAERPQRGRLREFLQWNVDVIGLPSEEATPESKAQMDAEIIECGINLFTTLGFTNQSIKIHTFHRGFWTMIFPALKIDEKVYDFWFAWMDAYNKRSPEQRRETALSFGASDRQIEFFEFFFSSLLSAKAKPTLSFEEVIKKSNLSEDDEILVVESALAPLHDELMNSNLDQWTWQDPKIVRGLAYYTGTVFEALADGERAVAGGGRYDNLIELFGGPPTPACGFGMGDVVLGNLLGDKELMPTGVELMEAVARPQASIRPEAFIVPNGDEDNEDLVHILTANLRRGIESNSWLANDSRKPWNKDRYTVAPMHARISYKSTRKPNKLRDDAMKQHAKFFIVINNEENAELHNLDTRESLGTFSTNPTANNYIGSALTNHL